MCLCDSQDTETDIDLLTVQVVSIAWLNTDCSLFRFEIKLRACEEVAINLGLDSGFPGSLITLTTG